MKSARSQRVEPSIGGVQYADDDEDNAATSCMEKADDIPCTRFEIKRWCYLLCLASILMATFLGLFVFYAASSGCGDVKNFAHTPSNIPADLERMMRSDLIVPDGCNVCPELMRAVWIAPGDMCRLQADGKAKYHGPLSHCDNGYGEDFDPNHHVKACLSSYDLKDLWDDGYCHNNHTGIPFYSNMKEGLLFCGWNGWWKCWKTEDTIPSYVPTCEDKNTWGDGTSCYLNPGDICYIPFDAVGNQIYEPRCYSTSGERLAAPTLVKTGVLSGVPWHWSC